MIIPNLCCSICIEPGSMHCVSVVVPHPSYLPEGSWKRIDDDGCMVVVDKHTIDLMRRYGYLLHRRGDVIMSVEIDCNEKDLRKHMKTLTSIAPETKETKETKVEEMLESLDISEVTSEVTEID
jgi:hypothetical protein